MAKKKPVRDTSIPIAAWSIGDTRYEIRYTGPNEFVQAKYNPKHYWGGKTPSIIVTDYTPNGIRETEYDAYSPRLWGWILRLITDGTLDRSTFKALSKTDSDLLRDSL